MTNRVLISIHGQDKHPEVFSQETVICLKTTKVLGGESSVLELVDDCVDPPHMCYFFYSEHHPEVTGIMIVHIKEDQHMVMFVGANMPTQIYMLPLASADISVEAGRLGGELSHGTYRLEIERYEGFLTS